MSQSIDLEFGSSALRLSLPANTDVLRLAAVPALPDAAGAVRAALASPLGALPLVEIAANKVRSKGAESAVIVVSDKTRPVPYRGPEGILEPVIGMLRAAGVGRITILVATGTHSAMDDAELRRMLPDSVFHEGIEVINHDCRDAASLQCLGRTRRGTDIWLNRLYLDADLRILTGLVEPHFMAGVSGGPKTARVDGPERRAWTARNDARGRPVTGSLRWRA